LDTGHRHVQVFDTSGAFLAVWDGAGSGGAPFVIPNGIAADEAGAVYVADLRRGYIQKFQPRGPWPTPGVWKPTTARPVTTPSPPARPAAGEAAATRPTPADR
jgi:hypothetical protein